MTPSFALDLSLDGIRLLFRAEGGWTVIGDVAIEDPALGQRLAALRSEGETIAGGPVATEVVIPPSQIRYATVPKPAVATVTDADLAPAIAGLTPLDLAELAFDFAVDGGEVRLALVDRQTLTEAEAFATAYGFAPVSFGARPTPAQFPRNPDFGPAGRSAPAAAAAVPPPPETAAAPVGTPDAAKAEALARSLSAPRPGERGGAPQRATLPRRMPRLALGAGGLAAAALLIAIGLRGPADPAAGLPETAPEIAAALPALGAPGPAEAPPAAPAADPAPAAPESVATAPSEPAADAAAEIVVDRAPAAPGAGAPSRPAPPQIGATDAIQLAAIDPVSLTRDAVALPALAVASLTTPPAVPQPPAAGAPEPAPAASPAAGTPGAPPAAAPAAAVDVVFGPPPVLPPERSVSAPPAAAAPASAPPDAADLASAPPVPTDLARALPDRRPLARPEGLAERTERAMLGGRTRAELAALRPLARPVSEQAAAVATAPAPPSEEAVARSLLPRDRPADFATRVATANAIAAALAAPPPPAPAAPEPAPEPAPAPQVAAAAPPPPAAAPEAPPAEAEAETYDDGETDVASAAPDIPTSASVARQATIRNAMSLREINLIGVFGTERDRRALVRLPSGRMVKVEVGDRLDGGRIAAIGRDELRYVKGGRNITLEVPSG